MICNPRFPVLYLLASFVISSTLYGQNNEGFNSIYIKIVQEKFNLSADDVADYVISDNYVSGSTGMRHIYLQQRYQGIEIYNAVMSLHISSDDTLIHSTSSFVGRVNGRINSKSTGITPENALASASQHLNLAEPSDLEQMHSGMFNGAGISENNIPYTPVYQLAGDGRLILCWSLVIKDTESADWWDIRVDANTGEVVDKTNWTVKCSWEHGLFVNHHKHRGDQEDVICENNESLHSHAGLAGTGSYNVYPLGIESPNYGSRSLVIDPADANASPFAWHDTDGVSGPEYTITRGNNVYAYEDRDANNEPGFSPDGEGTLSFDFPIDPSLSPAANESAAITNLFYWNNLMHDIWYDHGFDEAAGNFQANNYGKGGTAGDHVLAEAQDGEGFENANFSTPPDGQVPRMQMYLFRKTSEVDVMIEAPVNLTLNDPAIAAHFGPDSYTLSGELVLVNDGSATPSQACYDLVNAIEVQDKIAVINETDDCQYGWKALKAQEAGAKAVIICRNVSDPPFAMGPGFQGNAITIPTLMVSQADGQTLQNALPGVTLNLSLSFDPDLDGDLDNGIIAHEYGHGISNRLTGGPANVGCLNNLEQMGEGWSDWFGLMLTMEAGDAGEDSRGVGTYTLNQSASGNGVRAFPYSTDMAINPHTYGSIATAKIPHGVGSVWCAMLWEITWMLIDEYGFDPDLYHGTGGNNIAMKLVTLGLKLQPCSPGFVDGRDAILAADQMLYDGGNQCLIWMDFAKRGLGFGASQGSSSAVNDGTEAYVLPVDGCLSITKTVDIAVANPGDTLTYEIAIKPQLAVDLTPVDILHPNLFYVEGSANGTGQLFGTPPGVTWHQMNLGFKEDSTLIFKAFIDPAMDTSPYDTLEDAETVTNTWIPTATNPSLGNWMQTGNDPYAGSGVWFAPDVESANEEHLTIANPIMPSKATQLKFWHQYDTEPTWDGGLVEVSTDNRKNWQDLGQYIIQNPYNSTIDNNAQRPAFSGNSGGYIESIVDLSAFADKNIFVRFRMHCDELEGGDGWYIDNIEFNDLFGTIPNTVTVSATFFGSQTLTLFYSLDNPTKISPFDCEDLLVLSTPLENIAQEYRAHVEIQANSLIKSNSDIYLKAGDNLKFSNGFEVQLGSALTASIGNCDEIPALNKAKNSPDIQSVDIRNQSK